MDQEGKNWDKEGIPGSGQSVHGYIKPTPGLKGSGFSKDVNFCVCSTILRV